MNICAWSKSCLSPGPFVAQIDGEWYICDDPFSADRPLYCTSHAREFQRLNIRNVITEDGESTRNAAASPYLLYPRRMIDTAVADGQEVRKGEPTEGALYARAWVEYKPDWRDPEDWYGSFEWCCHWLGLNIDQERASATTKIDQGLAAGILKYRQADFSRRQKQAVAKAIGIRQEPEPAPIVTTHQISQPDAAVITGQLEMTW